MNTMDTILSRSSVRNFTNQPIPGEALHAILRAGMAGPSCVNAKDWSFLVVENRDTLNRMADANGAPAGPLRHAAAAVLICGDLGRAFPPAPEYWVIDGAIAGQNMMLAAQGLGLGSVWLGTWPQMDRVKKQAELFGLPDTAVPHSILAFGYPETVPPEKADPYDAAKVHFEQW